MEILDNISRKLGDDLKTTPTKSSKLRIAADKPLLAERAALASPEGRDLFPKGPAVTTSI